MLLSPAVRSATSLPSDSSLATKSMDSENHSPASDLKRQFEAAVKVIRGLPADQAKDAPFQPSDDLKLRFYAFFKQATEGPNQTAKPAFYDIVGKYKWQAWSSLGNMSREEAMRSYVDELKKIIEAMSLTQPVSDFYDVLGPFYEFVATEKPSASKMNGNAIRPASGSKVNGHVNGDTNETESDGEEFSDTYDHISDDNPAHGSADRKVNADEIISARGEAELTPPRFGSAATSRSSASRAQSSRADRSLRPGTSGSDDLSAGASGDGYDKPGRREAVPDVNEQIAIAILRLQQSMEQVENRLYSLENQIRSANASRNDQSVRRKSRGNGWWPFDGLSPSATLFVLVWPVLTHLMIERVRSQRSGK